MTERFYVKEKMRDVNRQLTKEGLEMPKPQRSVVRGIL